MYAPLYKASYALVIGVDQYTDLPPLQTAVHDAEAVADQLGGMGFDVQMLLNDEASRDAILENVDRLTNTEPDDRVIIYFAGHGITRSTTTGHSVGMLAPYGQRRSAYHQAIQMKTLIEHSQFIPAKHILFLLDACFSGLALTRGGGAPNRVIADLLTRRAVQVIAAGQAEQEVSDLWGPGSHSIFTGLMLDRIHRTDSLLTANELGLWLQRQVGLHTRSRQTPHYGNALGSQGGDLVFRVEEVHSYLPADMRAALSSSQAWMRKGAISGLTALLRSGDEFTEAEARLMLETLARSDPDSGIRERARRALDPAYTTTTPIPREMLFDLQQPAIEEEPRLPAVRFEEADAETVPSLPTAAVSGSGGEVDRAAPEPVTLPGVVSAWWQPTFLIGTGVVAVSIWAILYLRELAGTEQFPATWSAIFWVPAVGIAVVGIGGLLGRRAVTAILALLTALLWTIVAVLQWNNVTTAAWVSLFLVVVPALLSFGLTIWTTIDAVRRTV